MRRPLPGRRLDEHVAEGAGAAWARRQDRAGERARPRTCLDHREHLGLLQLGPPVVERPGDDGTEQRPDLRAGEEVAAAAGAAARGVEAPVRVVQRELDDLLERDRAAPAISARTRSSTGVIDRVLARR